MGKIASARPTEWISPGEAARLVGVCLTTFKKRSQEWGIRVRFVPGVNRRQFNRSDVERFVAALPTTAATGELPPVLMKGRNHEGGSTPRELQTNGEKGTARPRR